MRMGRSWSIATARARVDRGGGLSGERVQLMPPADRAPGARSGRAARRQTLLDRPGLQGDGEESGGDRRRRRGQNRRRAHRALVAVMVCSALARVWGSTFIRLAEGDGDAGDDHARLGLARIDRRDVPEAAEQQGRRQQQGQPGPQGAAPARENATAEWWCRVAAMGSGSAMADDHRTPGRMSSMEGATNGAARQSRIPSRFSRTDLHLRF